MKNIRLVLAGLVLTASIILSSCGGDSAATPPPSNIKVTISPATVTLNQGATHQFTASVTGTTNSAVTWSVVSPGGGNIDSQGVYTAPGKTGSFIVVATSVADSSKTSSAVAMVNAVVLSVSPVSPDMQPGTTQQFTATATGCVNQNVIWSVQEGATGGSITSGGVYTAPGNTGTFHIVATSASDGTATASVAVTVANLAVSITPNAIKLLAGTKRTFTGSVLGSMDDRVTWAVQEGSGGVIAGDGAYTAPSALGEYHVIATSVAHPGISGTATVVVTDSGFTDTGEMTVVRYNHTGTLLPDGNVLIAGGTDDSYSETKSAEVFDPTAGDFRKTGDMAEGRQMHTATFVQGNGKVLVAGGGIDFGFGFGSLDSAELYDPATGQFAATGKMQTGRYAHTATELKNGKVLLAGGIWREDYVATAELYDPATGVFTATGSMSKARANHTATLLSDGRVLVAGGAASMGDTSAEIYDPANGAFTPTNISFRRDSHTATLLDDGRVLLAGGYWWDWETWDETFYDDAQYFDPSSGQLTLAAKMNNERSGHTATPLLSGQILFVGGHAGHESSTSAELFVPATSAFVTTGTLRVPRTGHTATRLKDGRVLVAGGSDDKSAELYTQKP